MIGKLVNKIPEPKTCCINFVPAASYKVAIQLQISLFYMFLMICLDVWKSLTAKGAILERLRNSLMFLDFNIGRIWCRLSQARLKALQITDMDLSLIHI